MLERDQKLLMSSKTQRFVMFCSKIFQDGKLETLNMQKWRNILVTGFLPCPWTVRVIFLSDNSKVVVESVDGVDNHKHEEDPDFVEEASTNKRWTNDMEEVIKNVIIHHTKPNAIKRDLKDCNVCGRNFPTKTQLYNKIVAMRKKISPSTLVMNTQEMRQAIAPMLEKPEFDNEAYVPYFEIEDKKENESPRFTIIFSTPKNLTRMEYDRVLQTDVTYRLIWLVFPLLGVGISTPTGKFFETCSVISSHEDEKAWASIYKFIQGCGFIIL